VLEKGAQFKFRAKGFSMSPFIRDGDVLTVSPFLDRSPAFGDVAAFIHPGTGEFVVHRMIGIRDGAYLIQGDAALESDGRVPKEKVLGRVTQIKRNGQRIFLGLGPERYLIAFLSCRGLLLRAMHPLRKIVRPIMRGPVI
jgi:hypothetical protein